LRFKYRVSSAESGVIGIEWIVSNYAAGDSKDGRGQTEPRLFYKGSA
jgi:hypothetical protein